MIDFANKANEEIGKFRLEIILSPEKLKFDGYNFQLNTWQSIKFGNVQEIEQIPNDKRGIYAFAICHPQPNLPPHGYILYIGIAGRKSSRSLRARYKDYLLPGLVSKRARIAYMIGNWSEVLRFFYVPVEDNISSEQLEEMEKYLNTALLPPFSEGDLEVETKKRRRAFK